MALKRQSVITVALSGLVVYLIWKDLTLIVDIALGSIPLYSPCKDAASSRSDINVTAVKTRAVSKYSTRLKMLSQFCDKYSWSDHLLGKWTNQVQKRLFFMCFCLSLVLFYNLTIALFLI